MWKNRDSQLDNVPGFLNFNLIKGKTKDDYTIFASHSIWKSSSDFINWTNSKEFRNLYRFNCISSGFIKSKMSDEILNYYTSKQKKNILKRQNNLFIPKSKLIKTIYSLCYNNKINGKVIKLHR